MHGTARVEGMGLINCWVVACVACLPLPVQLLSLTVVCWHVFAFMHTACMHVHTNVFMLHIDAYMYAHVHMYMYVCTCVGQLVGLSITVSHLIKSRALTRCSATEWCKFKDQRKSSLIIVTLIMHS